MSTTSNMERLVKLGRMFQQWISSKVTWLSGRSASLQGQTFSSRGKISWTLDIISVKGMLLNLGWVGRMELLQLVHWEALTPGTMLVWGATLPRSAVGARGYISLLIWVYYILPKYCWRSKATAWRAASASTKASDDTRQVAGYNPNIWRSWRILPNYNLL